MIQTDRVYILHQDALPVLQILSMIKLLLLPSAIPRQSYETNSGEMTSYYYIRYMERTSTTELQRRKERLKSQSNQCR